MSKLLKKFRKQNRKQNKPTPVRQRRRPGQGTRRTTLTHLKKYGAEEDRVRSFLEQAAKIKDDDKLLSATRKFATYSSDSWSRRTRRQLFLGRSGVLTLLPLTEYRKFIKAYLSQDKKGSQQFWDDYMEKPSVRRVIESRAKERDEEEAEQRRINEILESEQRKEVVVEEVDVVKPLPKKTHLEKMQRWLQRKPKSRRSTIMVEVVIGDDGKPVIGDDGKEVLRKVEERPRPYRRVYETRREDPCIRVQQSAPWLEGAVRGCYVLPIGKGMDISKYANTADAVEVELATGEKIKLYRAKKSFYKLLCGMQSRMNEQEGEVLHVHTSGKIIDFYVAYRVLRPGTPAKMAVQNDETAAKKASWYERQREGRTGRMRRLLGEPVTPLLVSTCTSSMASAISRITGRDGNEFALAACEAIRTEFAPATAKKYIGRVATILAYLNEPEAVVFRERVKEGWYNPTTFVSLTPQQMLPHTTIGGDSKLGMRNASLIVDREKRVTRSLSNTYYQLNHNTERVPTRSDGTVHLSNVTVNEWRGKCINKDDIQDVPDYRLVIYQTEEGIYCLDVNQLEEQTQELALFEDDLEAILESGEIVNPYNDEPLEKKFLKDLVQKFNNIDWLGERVDEDEEDEDEEEEEEDDKPLPFPPEKMLAPGLMDMVLNNIDECKKELEREPDERCPAMDRTDEGDEESDDEESDEESDDEESDEEGDDEESDEESDDEEAPPPPELSPQGPNVCDTCNTRVSTESSYNTIKYSEGEYTPVHFCGRKCAEEAKFKQKKGKKKGGKKGGRNGTKERAKR